MPTGRQKMLHPVVEKTQLTAREANIQASAIGRSEVHTHLEPATQNRHNDAGDGR
jgi:hypothetical protein